jgi:hypothetical protein
MEKNAIQVYARRAAEAQDATERSFYEWLAKWETEHLNFLSRLDKEITEAIWYDNFLAANASKSGVSKNQGLAGRSSGTRPWRYNEISKNSARNRSRAKPKTLQVPERPSSQASSFPVNRLCSAVVLISQTGSFSAARMGLPQHSGTLAPTASNSFFFPQVSHSNLRLSAMTPPWCTQNESFAGRIDNL